MVSKANVYQKYIQQHCESSTVCLFVCAKLKNVLDCRITEMGLTAAVEGRSCHAMTHRSLVHDRKTHVHHWFT